MGKLKGKTRSYPSEAGTPWSVGPMDTFIVRATGDMQRSGATPLEITGAAGALDESCGTTTSLSPDGHPDPPQPKQAEKPGASTTSCQPQVEGLVVRGEKTVAGIAVPVGSLAQSQNIDGVGTSDSTAKDLSQLASKPLDQTCSSSGQIFTFNLQRPEIVTLEVIWDILQQLSQALVAPLSILSDKVHTLEVNYSRTEQKLQELDVKVKDVEITMQSMKLLQTAMVKDYGVLHSKVETLENAVRATNMRLLNFPKLSNISAQEMFNKYMLEILRVPKDLIPPVVNVYYLPSGKRLSALIQEQVSVQLDTLNVSEILESSDIQNAIPATLLVKFALISDREWFHKLFLKFQPKEFLNLKIFAFPDVSKETQKQRKQFLLLKPGVLKLDALYLLRFPIPVG